MGGVICGGSTTTTISSSSSSPRPPPPPPRTYTQATLQQQHMLHQPPPLPTAGAPVLYPAHHALPPGYQWAYLMPQPGAGVADACGGGSGGVMAVGQGSPGGSLRSLTLQAPGGGPLQVVYLPAAASAAAGDLGAPQAVGPGDGQAQTYEAYGAGGWVAGEAGGWVAGGAAGAANSAALPANTTPAVAAAAAYGHHHHHHHHHQAMAAAAAVMQQHAAAAAAMQQHVAAAAAHEHHSASHHPHHPPHPHSLPPRLGSGGGGAGPGAAHHHRSKSLPFADGGGNPSVVAGPWRTPAGVDMSPSEVRRALHLGLLGVGGGAAPHPPPDGSAAPATPAAAFPPRLAASTLGSVGLTSSGALELLGRGDGSGLSAGGSGCMLLPSRAARDTLRAAAACHATACAAVLPEVAARMAEWEAKKGGDAGEKAVATEAATPAAESEEEEEGETAPPSSDITQAGTATTTGSLPPTLPSSPARIATASWAAAALAGLGLGGGSEEEEEEEEGGCSDPRKRATIYIGNLAPGVDELALLYAFHLFGPVLEAALIRDRSTSAPRGFAFLTFAAPASAARAIACMDGAAFGGPFEGKALKVGASVRACPRAPGVGDDEGRSEEEEGGGGGGATPPLPSPPTPPLAEEEEEGGEPKAGAAVGAPGAAAAAAALGAEGGEADAAPTGAATPAAAADAEVGAGEAPAVTAAAPEDDDDTAAA